LSPFQTMMPLVENIVLEETGNSKVRWCTVLIWYSPVTLRTMQVSICFLQKVHLCFSST